jgi:N-glycosylase/DNA lyase
MEELNKKRIKDLIAIGLYQARANKVKEYIMTLYKNYEEYLKPIDNVREILAREIGKKSLSKEVVKLRRKEMH